MITWYGLKCDVCGKRFPPLDLNDNYVRHCKEHMEKERSDFFKSMIESTMAAAEKQSEIFESLKRQGG